MSSGDKPDLQLMDGGRASEQGPRERLNPAADACAIVQDALSDPTHPFHTLLTERDREVERRDAFGGIIDLAAFDESSR